MYLSIPILLLGGVVAMWSSIYGHPWIFNLGVLVMVGSLVLLSLETGKEVV